MDYLLPTFKIVSIIFAISAVATGAQAIVDPVGFSRFFGLPVLSTMRDTTESLIDNDDTATSRRTTIYTATSRRKTILQYHRNLVMSYISLMGVRQLATGIILLTFAYQNKWTEMATILAIIGIIVAGTDGAYLSHAGSQKLGRFHAIPGGLIAILAGGVIYLNR
jgi:hypothetical protein